MKSKIIEISDSPVAGIQRVMVGGETYECGGGKRFIRIGADGVECSDCIDGPWTECKTAAEGGYFMPKAAHDALVEKMDSRGETPYDHYPEWDETIDYEVGQQVKLFNGDVVKVSSRHIQFSPEYIHTIELSNIHGKAVFRYQLQTKLVWSKEPPTVPGWYWIREPGREPFISKVFTPGTGRRDDIEWCGPITPPE